MKEGVMVIAPHPDDETLGAGGTLLRMKAQGYETFWVIFTRVDESVKSKEWIEKRKKEIEEVSKRYGFAETFELGFITTRLDEYPLSELIASFFEVLHRVKPGIVLVNHPWDIHSDHKIVFQAVMSALKTFRAPFVERIMVYETITETDQGALSENLSFVPNVFVDVSDFLEKKLDIMSVYESEIMDHPWGRSLDSIRALARYRGSFIGVEYAEAFYLVREIILKE